MRIMIVEDDPAHAEAIRRALETDGTEKDVRVAGSLREYRQEVALCPPDIALVDLNLPDGRAVEVLTSPAEAALFPVVVMTSYGNEHTAVEALKAGALDYVVKSPEAFAFMPRTVARALREWGLLMDRKQAEESVRRLNQELEKRVRERTAQLEAANRELESFGYTVSHDLRAPLRHMRLYCDILEEECREKLGEGCRGHLGKIRASATRMTQLVDALLRLSQLSHGELDRLTTDLALIARKIVAELVRLEPERQVEFRIAGSVVVQADPTLMEIVMENLLHNAWKYTAKKERAVIEFSRVEIDGTSACMVRDNGAGFDMTYADRLFGPFQRLHSESEFEGIGVGLATVQRIILRHGGRVWAEAERGRGAKFYFTLAEEPEKRCPKS